MSTAYTPIALVTGATRGIGLETVSQLTRQGVHVLLGGRRQQAALEQARLLQQQGLSVEAIALEVTDAASIAAAQAYIRQRHGRLDILVNNAGILRDDPGLPPSAQSLDTWRATFETNLFAVVAVTQAMLPLLRGARAGRIVNVSSILGSLTLHSQPDSPVHGIRLPAYNASKSALNAWTLQLAQELADTPIKVNTVHPGYVRTDMNAGQGELDLAAGARSSVAMALLADDGPTGSFSHLGQVLPW